MQINWKVLAPYLLSIVLLALLFFRSKETIVVRVPSQSGSFSLVGPEPEKTEPPTAQDLQEFNDLPDEQKAEAYEEATTSRTYTKTFIDKVQTITATVKTIGTLEELEIDYKTEPIKKEVDLNKRAHVFLGGEVSFPNGVPSYELKAHFELNKVLISAGYDLRNRAPSIGAAIKIF